MKASRVVFEFASMRDVNLQGADLNRAELAGADLTGANVSGMLIDGGDVQSAILKSLQGEAEMVGLDTTKNLDEATLD